jgi:hypothetical protein
VDPKHDHMLKMVARHAMLERARDVEGTLSTLVPDPVYTLWNGVRIEGMDAVRRFYTKLLGGGPSQRPSEGPAYQLGWKPKPFIDEVTRGVWVNDDGVVLDCLMPHQKPDGTVVRYPLIAVFPFRDGLIVGENVTTVPEYSAIMVEMHGDFRDI